MSEAVLAGCDSIVGEDVRDVSAVGMNRRWFEMNDDVRFRFLPDAKDAFDASPLCQLDPCGNRPLLRLQPGVPFRVSDD